MLSKIPLNAERYRAYRKQRTKYEMESRYRTRTAAADVSWVVSHRDLDAVERKDALAFLYGFDVPLNARTTKVVRSHLRARRWLFNRENNELLKRLEKK